MWASHGTPVNSGMCLAAGVTFESTSACLTTLASIEMDNSGITWGPAPAQITITNLNVVTATAAVGPGDSQKVVVLLNGVATALTCNVTSGQTACTSTAAVTVPAGDFLEVEVTTPSGGTFGGSVVYRVSFTY